MTPPIVQTFRKDLLHPVGHGYGWQDSNKAWHATRFVPLRSWLVHTTNNSAKNTKFWNEATFIRDSPDVSCNDMIGKDGTLAIILPPDMVAWHAGQSLVQFGNLRSGGTELHCSVGEKPTAEQIATLTWRMQQLIAKFGLKPADIETHRAAALPKGRKSDPEGWPDAEFYAWRDSLFVPSAPDYSILWGNLVPYFDGSGIAASWRDNAAALGQATSDETTDKAGTVWRLFRGGAVSYSPMTGKTVVYVPRKQNG